MKHPSKMHLPFVWHCAAEFTQIRTYQLHDCILESVDSSGYNTSHKPRALLTGNDSWKPRFIAQLSKNVNIQF